MATAVTGTTPTDAPSSDAANLASLPADAISYADLYCALGARQLAGDRAGLHRGRAPVARGLHRVRAHGGAVELLRCSSGARTRSPTTSPRTSTRRRWRSRSTSWPPSRSTRRATRSSSSASCTRSAGIGDGSMASGLNAIKPQLTPGLSQDLRPPGTDGRRAARRPLPRPTRRGGDALPHRDRGVARPARPALHLQLPRTARPAAGVPPGHAEHRRRRAAPHRLRREAAVRPATAKTPSACPRRSPSSCAT